MTDQSAFILRVTYLMMMMMFSTDAKFQLINSKPDAAVGDEVIMICKAGAEGEITWHKDGVEIDDEEKVSKVDEESSKLILKKATLEDAGRYTCVCEFETGHRDERDTQLYVYDGPSFTTNKTYHEFLEGNEAVVPCLVVGSPAVDVQWFRNKEQISSDGATRVHQRTDNTLVIRNVKRDDGGTYVCQAQIRGRPVYQQQLVSVVVNAPPSVRVREELQRVMAGPSSNTSLLCLVHGSPPPNISWTLPVTFDPSRHLFNSDRSQLTILSVTTADNGKYMCTATNKIAESSATTRLEVFEAPEVFVSTDLQSVSVGGHVSVSCNVSGHPQPELHWLNKHNGRTLDSVSGRVRAVDGVLLMDGVVSSDGGLYSCVAVSASGNASRDVAIHTQPGPPHYLSVSPGPTSVVFSLKDLPVSGGTPITSFVLQWRRGPTEPWAELTVPVTDSLSIPSLKPYTWYRVRLAALNAVGLGPFSDSKSVRTQGIQGEPDSPVLSPGQMRIDGNSFSVPLTQIDDGGSPLLHFTVRFRQDKEAAEWTELRLSKDADSILLPNLSFGSDYHLEVTAVNANGSSVPASFNFTIAERPVKPSGSMTKGSVVGIVMFIFLVVFLVVDASCCYRNRCGLLMSIAVKLFGQRVPGLKMMEDGDGATNGEVKLKGLPTPRGSLHQVGVQTQATEAGTLREVTCDKAPLTKHEKTQPGRELTSGDA
ncbi:neural cell adhesion molecule 1 isoform X1 [Sphaeramia orbicularis]|uniref:neural cell adhesion molecule 1 isoform X1 n=1 Tax=Sphaeramia orbicularis TaxID=375764 RepID=UPI0011800A41|nr:neural cell adhesion molecule 1-like isoform X1 [Sphaeramia orbicularis]